MQGRRTAYAAVLAAVLLPGLSDTTANAGAAGPIKLTRPAHVANGSAVGILLTSVGLPAANHAKIVLNAADRSVTGSIPMFGTQAAARKSLAIDHAATPVSFALLPPKDMTKEFENAMNSGVATEQVDPAQDSCSQMVPALVSAFQSFLKRVAMQSFERMQEYASLGKATVIGTASTYNPYNEGNKAEDFQTSSGELYDPTAWTAAIQIKLRPYFGGVRYGRNYRPAYALVDNGVRRLIVKINDVGPLKPGRVIDLNERAMRYFDPSLQRGLVPDVTVTLLPGDDWTTGPVGVEQPVSVASAE